MNSREVVPSKEVPYILVDFQWELELSSFVSRPCTLHCECLYCLAKAHLFQYVPKEMFEFPTSAPPSQVITRGLISVVGDPLPYTSRTKLYNGYVYVRSYLICSEFQDEPVVVLIPDLSDCLGFDGVAYCAYLNELRSQSYHGLLQYSYVTTFSQD